MARADATAGRIDRAAIDLAEAVMLEERVGETFAGVVTNVDERGGQIQLGDMPIVARVMTDALPGSELSVKLDAVDVAKRMVRFTVG